MPKKSLENLTESMFYVLMALRRGPMCGIDAAAFIEEKTKGALRLAKFEKEGYLREVAVDGRKRTYAITDKGEAAYQEEVCRLRRCVADADSEGRRWNEQHNAGSEVRMAVPALSGV